VHLIVEPGEVEHESDAPKQVGMAAIRERIEDPQLDGWMGSKRCNFLIAFYRFAIVDQYTHAHSAVASTHQSIGEQPAGFVTAKNESWSPSVHSDVPVVSKGRHRVPWAVSSVELDPIDFKLHSKL
jgi:hypothetical protein